MTVHGLPSFWELFTTLAIFSSPLWVPVWAFAFYFWRKARRLER